MFLEGYSLHIPLWLKILAYTIVGFTVIYAAVAFIRTVVG